jgi:hypothetical protein
MEFFGVSLGVSRKKSMVGARGRVSGRLDVRLI